MKTHVPLVSLVPDDLPFPWQPTNDGYSAFISDAQGCLPCGLFIQAASRSPSWKEFRDHEGEITHWTYTYSNGKIATIFND